MTLKPIVHEIRIQNQVIFLDPPIEYARSTWIKQLHDWLGKVDVCFIWLKLIMCYQKKRCCLSIASYSKFTI